MVQLAEPIITPAPWPTLLGRQYVQFRPRQTASDSNLGVGASAGWSSLSYKRRWKLKSKPKWIYVFEFFSNFVTRFNTAHFGSAIINIPHLYFIVDNLITFFRFGFIVPFTDFILIYILITEQHIDFIILYSHFYRLKRIQQFDTVFDNFSIIAGSAVGGALFAILLAVLVSLFCWRRRKNRKLGFIEALTRRSKEGKGAGGIGLLDGEFDDDEEYRDELAGVHMRERTTSAHSPQPSVGAGSMASLSGPTQNSQHANYPYNPAPTLYRARASDSGSMFHEEGVWPPPNHGTQFVDPFVPARELSKDSELGSIVDQIMGTDISAHASSLPPGAAPAVVPGAVGVPNSSSHVRGASGSSVNSTTPKRSSPLSKMLSKPDPPRSILTRTQTDPNASFDAHNNSTMVSSPTSIHPRNWLERQPKTPSPRDPPLTLPPPLNLSGTGGSSAPPSAFANSASSLVSAYGAPHMTSPPTSAGTSKHNKRVSWGELPTPSRPGSRTGSIAGGIGEAM
ncbi:hypothetical protein LENED_012356 [Lentinula edodes]|uniref:Uncharacterized protein n=2 Tax=Lentinula edodes TaxID=5353 RepID=A0A1Q3ESE5_LENED|nr:hypothetical protein LENED_012356 [Lentinula edodes]